MDKRSIWADEEVIIIKPLEVYCPVIKLISKLGAGGACERAAGLGRACEGLEAGAATR